MQKVKQLDPLTKSYILWHLVVLHFLTHHSSRLDPQQDDSEVGPSQIESQVVTLLCVESQIVSCPTTTTCLHVLTRAITQFGQKSVFHLQRRGDRGVLGQAQLHL